MQELFKKKNLENQSLVHFILHIICVFWHKYKKCFYPSRPPTQNRKIALQGDLSSQLRAAASVYCGNRILNRSISNSLQVFAI